MTIFVILNVFITFGQELPVVQNFYPTDYKGENQNWAISQSSEKLIYVANNKGLLEYNGAYWKHYSSPNESIMRSVKVIDDLIYTGSYMEFGYWKKNNLNSLEYFSISKKIDVDLIEDEEFWNIISIDDWIVFQSLKRIYIYDVIDGSVNYIESQATITKIFEIDQQLYFQRLGKGLFRIKDGKDILILDKDVIKNDEIINIFGSGEDLLILTKENGFYRKKGEKLIKFESLSNPLLSNMSIYDAIMLENKNIALGTIANGLIILNTQGEIISHLNMDQGLLNNTVLSLFEDVSNNIWLGLDNGISYLDTNSPFELHNNNQGISGSVYTSAIYNGNLYLGTNQGLFYRKVESNDNFIFIEGTQGQVWSLKVIEDILLCGHHSGTFLVEGGKVKSISNIQGAWGFTKVDHHPKYLLQGNYDGLYVLERTNDGYKLRNKLSGFDRSSRYFETYGKEIFVNHEYKGIFKLETDSAFTSIMKVSIDTTLKGPNSGIAKFKGDLLYAYSEGVFKYDSLNKKFLKDSLFSSAYSPNEYESGKMTFDERNDILWLFTKSNIVYIAASGIGKKERIKSIPLTSEVRKDIIGYENVLSLGEKNILVGATSGYTLVDINKSIVKKFTINIDQIKNRNKKDAKKLENVYKKGVFSKDQNNFEISFYTPNFNKHVRTLYQFQLLGIYNEWSDWSQNHMALFENLPYGDYKFNVRSKIADAVSENIASYAFLIEKPWYISNTMLYLYAITLVLGLIFIHTFYKRYYEKQRLVLIAKNDKARNFAHNQNEREIIKLKNEKLSNDFSSKSKELAASLMSIAKKNDLLRAVKNELKEDMGEDTIKSVIDDINKNLILDNDWDFFQEAFKNADSDFLKNLKAIHPLLTPGDLKLCGYLRLNLSTKEMSDLLNITSRSVEIKRYRLRKKLDLEHEDNLVNYILSL
jgi:DNA-binding CsgD family transcriptional regulator